MYLLSFEEVEYYDEAKEGHIEYEICEPYSETWLLFKFEVDGFDVIFIKIMYIFLTIIWLLFFKEFILQMLFLVDTVSGLNVV